MLSRFLKGGNVQYRARFENDLKRFVSDGLVSQEQARAMLETIPVDRRSLGTVHVLVMFAAILLCAALFSFIAANWDAIPRLVRVFGILLVCWAGYGTAGISIVRGQAKIAQGALLVALCSFGGGIALIGQMYHLSGDWPDAVLLWASGAFVTALVMRAPVAAILFVGLSGAYLFGAMEMSVGWHGTHAVWIVPLLVLSGFALSRWTSSMSAMHLVAMVSILYGLWVPYYFDLPYLLWVVALAAFLKLVLLFLFEDSIERLTGFSESSAFYLALAVFAALFLLQINVYDDSRLAMVLMVLFVLSAIVGLLIWRGGASAPLRWLCYSAFAFQVLYLYVETIGSLIGTAGFFLLLALFVLAIAGLVLLTERLLAKRKPRIGDMS